MKPTRLAKVALAFLISSSIFLPSCSKQNYGDYVYPVNANAGEVPTVINLNVTGTASNTAFTKVNVDLQSVQYNVSAEAGVIDGWEDVNLQQPGVIDILSLLNGENIRLNGDMLPGNIRQLRMRFGQNNSVEIDGQSRPLTVSNELKDTGLVVFVSMDQTSMYAKSIWLNLDATQSVYHDEFSDEYILIPSFGSFDETTTGAIEGFVSPADAKATIQLYGNPNSRNTYVNVTSVEDEKNQGYFKFVGVPAGIYQIEMVSGDGTDRKKTVTDVEVKVGETKNIGSNELQ